MGNSAFPTGHALVVGGSGGVGTAICAALAHAGTDVVLTWRHNQDGAAAAAETVREGGTSARTVRLDLADTAAVESLVADIEDLHTVVYAAGPDLPMQHFSRIPAEQFRAVVDADLHGFANLARASLPRLRASEPGSGGGSIVAVSTAGLVRYPPKDVLSVAPKGAVEAIVRAIAREEGRYGVRANAVALGVIDAGIFARAKDRFSAEWVTAAKANIPLGRWGTAADAAAAVVFLASKQAAYITGQTLVVDGGFSV